MQTPEYLLCWKAGCSENCLSGLERAGRKRTPARVQRAALPLYVIDVWEAMSVSRPYRRAMPQSAILGYIARSSGTLFDPEVVAAFLGWRKKASGDSWPKLIYPAERKPEKEKPSVF